MWNQLAEIGILGLGLRRATSGGQIEIQVVLTEIGRRLAPEPVVHAALGPGALIAELGTAEQRALLDEVAAGERLLAFAHAEPGMRRPTAVVTTSAAREGDSWVLSGRKNPVLAGDCADTLVVSAALPDGGTGLFVVTPRRCIGSPTAPSTGSAVPRSTSTGWPPNRWGRLSTASAALSAHALVRISSALCAEAVGAMEEALRLTAEYLTQRKQFGVTLSKFQTLTQRAADMYVSLELARSMSAVRGDVGRRR